jgi:hypothetical protein
MKKLLFITIIVALLPLNAYASIWIRNLGDVEVVAEGNRKTKISYLESLVKKCVEMDDTEGWDSLDTAGLGQCILNSRHFASSRASAEEPVIRLRLEERVTLIPIPYFSSDRESTAAGGFLFESNLLGYGKGLWAGGSISTEGDSFMFFYSDPYVFFSDWSMSIGIKRGRNDIYSTFRDTEYSGHELEELDYGLYVGYRFLNHAKVYFTLNLTDRQYSPLGPYTSPADYEFADLGTTLSYKNANYKLYFNKGFQASASYAHQVYRSDGSEKPSRFSAEASWERNTIDTHALQLAVNYQSVFKAGERDTLRLGNKKGFRGISGNGLWARNAAAASIDYHIPFLKRKHGVWTIAPFVDYGMYNPVHSLPEDWFVAYGVGAYMYLNTFAIPGIGIVAGHNDNFMGSFLTVSAGMSMF